MFTLVFAPSTLYTYCLNLCQVHKCRITADVLELVLIGQQRGNSFVTQMNHLISKLYDIYTTHPIDDTATLISSESIESSTSQTASI